MNNTSKPLIIRDEIHGDMSFDLVLRAAIDHPNFQRLRHIQQLGLAYYVFPCASHTRFQHSLGCSFLAGRYFDQMIESWAVSAFDVPFDAHGSVGKTEFLTHRTRKCLKQVSAHEDSLRFWSRVVRLAGLLHDIGHGPWSHTFETLDVPHDFKKPASCLEPISKSYLKGLDQKSIPYKHEEIGLLYLHEIIHQLNQEGALENAELFYVSIAALINKRLLAKPTMQSLESRLQHLLESADLLGGIDMHRLIRPLISGPFDVDRIDYIQRDGRNCGVHIGGIEWGRILGQVMPCLAKHSDENGEPSDVVLVSNAKNQHVLDDFTFSLYQMYAQVYLHPKIVGLEESIRRELTKVKQDSSSNTITLDLHRSLSDEKFSDYLSDRFGAQSVRKLLMREKETTFDARCFLSDSRVESELSKTGYEKVEILNRPFLKDRMGVFLFNVLGEENAQCFVNAWFETSPIAREFHSLNYCPQIWVRKRGRGRE